MNRTKRITKAQRDACDAFALEVNAFAAARDLGPVLAQLEAEGVDVSKLRAEVASMLRVDDV